MLLFIFHFIPVKLTMHKACMRSISTITWWCDSPFFHFISPHGCSNCVALQFLFQINCSCFFVNLGPIARISLSDRSPVLLHQLPVLLSLSTVSLSLTDCPCYTVDYILFWIDRPCYSVDCISLLDRSPVLLR